MRWEPHVRFGGRAEETGRLKDRNCASARPLPNRANPIVPRAPPGRHAVRDSQVRHVLAPRFCTASSTGGATMRLWL